MFLKILAVFFIVFSTSIKAASKELVIGCTTKCDMFFRLAFKRVTPVGLKIRLIDLSEYGETDFSKLDGIIIPGGADIDPRYYVGQVEPELADHIRSLDHLVKYSSEGRRRDPFEFEFLKRYFNDPSTKNLPVLGICRGMQVLGVSQGVPLYIDIKTELGIRNRRFLFDRINLQPEASLINDLFEITSFKAFKRHHQGLRVNYFNDHADRWPHLKITSFSNQGLIAESLEFMNRPVLGVQFHPENDFGFERKIIFNWLIREALKRDNEIIATISM